MVLTLTLTLKKRKCFFFNFLCRFAVNSLKFPALHPYLDSVGGPDFKRGCNFAMADSTILPNNTTSNPNIVSPLTFGVQVDQFIHFRSRVLQLLRNGKFT